MKATPDELFKKWSNVSVLKWSVVCPYVILCSMISIIEDSTVSNQPLHTSFWNDIQRTVGVNFKKFYSSNFTTSCKDRPPLKNYIDCIMPLRWKSTQYPRARIQNNVHFNYIGRYHTEFYFPKCISLVLKYVRFLAPSFLCPGVMLCPKGGVPFVWNFWGFS